VGHPKLLTDMTQDKQTLRAALSAIEPGDDTSSYAELSRVLRSTSESLDDGHRGPCVYRRAEIVSAPGFADLRLGRRYEAGGSSGSNRLPCRTGRSRMSKRPRRVFDTKKVRTVATVAAYGTAESVRKVTLLANGKPLETKQVKFPPTARATVGVPGAGCTVWD